MKEKKDKIIKELLAWATAMAVRYRLAELGRPPELERR